ncbi:hypothetical protein FISHEDRAFT_71655 [Fistulina hepatica ATCC 64428]|uniref:Uncharacterized protein n=1 Tax=Fistulina hepatica ATCC 64428 TaxID=1128425 RepID=A0A0D7AIE6_9AGAR|nr:hypothetical protein FISHEDRAFT_71655 [Fistulina hepatica ATCC 64428]
MEPYSQKAIGIFIGLIGYLLSILSVLLGALSTLLLQSPPSDSSQPVSALPGRGRQPGPRTASSPDEQQRNGTPRIRIHSPHGSHLLSLSHPRSFSKLRSCLRQCSDSAIADRRIRRSRSPSVGPCSIVKRCASTPTLASHASGATSTSTTSNATRRTSNATDSSDVQTSVTRSSTSASTESQCVLEVRHSFTMNIRKRCAEKRAEHKIAATVTRSTRRRLSHRSDPIPMSHPVAITEQHHHPTVASEAETPHPSASSMPSTAGPSDHEKVKTRKREKLRKVLRRPKSSPNLKHAKPFDVRDLPPFQVSAGVPAQEIAKAETLEGSASAVVVRRPSRLSSSPAAAESTRVVFPSSPTATSQMPRRSRSFVIPDTPRALLRHKASFPFRRGSTSSQVSDAPMPSPPISTMPEAGPSRPVSPAPSKKDTDARKKPTRARTQPYAAPYFAVPPSPLWSPVVSVSPPLHMLSPGLASSVVPPSPIIESPIIESSSLAIVESPVLDPQYVLLRPKSSPSLLDSTTATPRADVSHTPVPSSLTPRATPQTPPTPAPPAEKSTCGFKRSKSTSDSRKRPKSSDGKNRPKTADGKSAKSPWASESRSSKLTTTSKRSKSAAAAAVPRPRTQPYSAPYFIEPPVPRLVSVGAARDVAVQRVVSEGTLRKLTAEGSSLPPPPPPSSLVDTSHRARTLSTGAMSDDVLSGAESSSASSSSMLTSSSPRRSRWRRWMDLPPIPSPPVPQSSAA